MDGGKRALRRIMEDKLRRLSPEEKHREEKALLGLILASPEWSRASALLVYLPMPEEFDTRPLMRAAWNQGKSVALPRVLPERRQMEFRVVSGPDQELKRHRFGMEEPLESYPLFTPAPPRTGNFMLLPGLAFDAEGFRMGRGAGYYDTYLERWGEYLFAAAAPLGCQMVGSVPREPHDRRVQRIFSIPPADSE